MLTKSLSSIVAILLIVLITVLSVFAIYVFVAYYASSGPPEDVGREIVALKVEGVQILGAMATPNGPMVALNLFLRSLSHVALVVDRVYVIDPYGNVVYTQAIPETTVRFGEVTVVTIYIPRNVYNELLEFEIVKLVLSSSTGSEGVAYLTREVLQSLSSNVLLSGYKFVIINCSDADGWWVDTKKIVEAIAKLRKLGYQIDMLIINDTDQLANFIENPSNFEGRDWSNSIVINAHGEVVPIPLSYIPSYDPTTSECGSPDWVDWYRNISYAISNYRLVWVSVVGYPFYYVSNTRCSDWTRTTAGGIVHVYEVGDRGLKEILRNDLVECWSGYEWRVMVGNKSYHDFLDNSVPTSLTDEGLRFENEFYNAIVGEPLPQTLHCARAAYLASITPYLPIYANESTTIVQRMLVLYDDFDADTVNPTTVDPQGYAYWNLSGSYSIGGSSITLLPGTYMHVFDNDVMWNDLPDVGTSKEFNFTYLLNLSIASSGSSTVFIVHLSNPYTHDLRYVVVNVSLPLQPSTNLLGIEDLNGIELMVPVNLECRSSGCYAVVGIPYLPSTGATLFLIESTHARNYSLGEIFLAYDDFENSTYTQESWKLQGVATVVTLGSNHVLQLVPEDYGKVGRAYYSKQLPSDVGRIVIEFDYMIVNQTTPDSADGFVAFFFADYSEDLSTAGGGSLGFDNLSGYGIEFDIWRNPEFYDPDDSHIALINNSVSNHVVYNDLNALNDEPLQRNVWHHAKIVVDLYLKRITVTVDGYTVIDASFTSINVLHRWIGLSAATGGACDGVVIDNYRVYGAYMYVDSSQVDVVSRSIALIEIGSVALGNTKLVINATRFIPLDNEFHVLNASIVGNAKLVICIDGSCTSFDNLGILNFVKPFIGFHTLGPTVRIGWVKVYADEAEWSGPRFCVFSVKLGDGVLVLNTFSPPRDQLKEFGYALSDVDLDFIAKIAVLYPAYIQYRS